MYDRGTLVRLTKMKSLDPEQETIKPGQVVEGVLLTAWLKKGKCVWISISDDAGLKTGTVRAIRLTETGVDFDTTRSTYHLEKVNG